MARAVRDAGFEIIYTGLHQTPEMIVNAAVQEDVDLIGLSILSGAHNSLVPVIIDLLAEKEASDIGLFLGGIIPDGDIPKLMEMGVKEIFTPGAALHSIVDRVAQAVSKVRIAREQA